MTFVIDTDTIIHDSESVIQLISTIIKDGSSEQTGFSVVIYGDDIPSDLKIALITLEETQNVTQRMKAEAQVDETLDDAFNLIIAHNEDSIKHESDFKSVSLLEAFKIGVKQHMPKRDLKYKEKLGYSVKDQTIGSHDDQRVYFVFDNDNNLLYKDKDMAQMCQLFKHLDDNHIKNDDESIHFMFGMEFDAYDIRNIVCNNKKPDLIKWNTFFEFEEEIFFEKETMEKIYDITCPAVVKAPEGTLNLGNHVQWIDLETVKKCHLKYYSHHKDKTKQDELDITQSYIQVKDYVNDDNTFKKNDYLLTAEKIFGPMKKLGCTAAVVKIVKIKEGTKIYNQGQEKEYKLLKLYLTIPEAPMEYILDAEVDGDRGVNVDDKHTDPYNNKYSSAYSDEYYGISIERAGIEYSDTLDEDELYDYIQNGFNKAVRNIDEIEHGEYSAKVDDNYGDLYYNQNEEDFYKFMDEYNNGYYGEDIYDEDDDDGYYYIDYNYDEDDYIDYDYDEEEDLDEQIFEDFADFYGMNMDDFIYMDSEDIQELYDLFYQNLYYEVGGPDIDVSNLPNDKELKERGKVMKYLLKANNFVVDNSEKGQELLKLKAKQAAGKLGGWAFKGLEKIIGKKKAAKAKKWAEDRLEKVKEHAKLKAQEYKEWGIKEWKKTKYSKIPFRKIYKYGKALYKIMKGVRELDALGFKADYKWEKTRGKTKSIKGPDNLKVTFKGTGNLTLKYGYWFNFKMWTSFKFDWKILKKPMNMHIEFRLHGGWEIGTYVVAVVSGRLQATFEDVLNYGKTFTFFIG